MALRVALSFVLLLSLISFTATATSMHACVQEELGQVQCEYALSVKTGDRADAATDSVISIELSDVSGNGFSIDNLKTRGIMETGHKYFQRDNLDLFRIRETCHKICSITVTSAGEGQDPNWFLDYVEISMSKNGQVTTQSFPVNQWLSLSQSPYSLQANVDKCPRFSNLRSTLSYV